MFDNGINLLFQTLINNKNQRVTDDFFTIFKLK